MKYCEEYAALLDLFVDGELPPEEAERVRGHLEGCPGCRAYVDDALALRAAFPDVEDTVIPEGFTEGVMERIRTSQTRDTKVVELKRRNLRRWVGTVAAMAACCGLIVLARTGPAAPAGGESPMDRMESAAPSAVYHTDGETGIQPQAAPEAADEEKEEALVQERAKSAAPDNGSPSTGAAAGQRSLMATAAAPTAPADMPTPTEACMPESGAETTEDTAGEYCDDTDIALCLTVEEAGDLLDGFAPEREDELERRYRLNAMEYEALLEDLGRWERLPETPEGGFQVVVTGPFK